ncbi:MAG: YfhO family protein, partial [Gemmatimonadota bacterium]|nr:YfhO family protein [Gemmatimonadota bacterium]
SRTHPHSLTPAALPAPRFALGWASLVCAISTLALGFPALGGKFLVTPASDQYMAGFAFREFGASTLHQTGSFALWNPYLFGGLPYVAAMHGDIFYPTFLLRMLLPTDVAMTWGFMLHVFLAGLFTYLFLRAWGFGFAPALAGGVAYMMSGAVAGLVSPGHDGKLYITALFPLALWMVLLAVRDGRSAAYGALAIVVGLAVLTPHPQLLQYLLLGTGAFALFVAFTSAEGADRLPRDVAIRRLGIALAAVALGMAIGAIQYLPVREYVPWSPRAGGRGYAFATNFSLPIEELVNFYLPQFSGILFRYWGRNGFHLHSDYAGVVALLLAAAAFGKGAGRIGFQRFWSGTLVVTVLWALGGSTPFYHVIYALVPGTKFFQAPSTILYIVSFSIAMLASVGMERVLSRQLSARYFMGWIIGAAVVALLATVGLFGNIAQAVALPGRAELVSANASALTAGAWRSFLFVALAGGLGLAWMRERVPSRTLAYGLVTLLVVDSWSVLREYWGFSPRASVIFASDATLDYLKRQPQPGRVLTFPLSEDMAWHDPFLKLDGLMIHRIRSAIGYHGNELERYDQLAGADQGYAKTLLDPGFWHIANVRFLLTNVADIPKAAELAPLQGAKRVAGPVKDAAGTTVSLFELPGDNPAAWITPVIVKAPDDQILPTLSDPRFDPRRYALVDTSSRAPSQQISSPPVPLPIVATVGRYDPGHIQISLGAPAPSGSALMVSENYYPGWRATADGKPAEVTRADYSFMAVVLPAGARAVELTFRSASYETGRNITLAALLIAVLMALGGLIVDRRERMPPGG